MGNQYTLRIDFAMKLKVRQCQLYTVYSAQRDNIGAPGF